VRANSEPDSPRDAAIAAARHSEPDSPRDAAIAAVHATRPANIPRTAHRLRWLRPWCVARGCASLLLHSHPTPAGLTSSRKHEPPHRQPREQVSRVEQPQTRLPRSEHVLHVDIGTSVTSPTHSTWPTAAAALHHPPSDDRSWLSCAGNRVLPRDDVSARDVVTHTSPDSVSCGVVLTHPI